MDSPLFLVGMRTRPYVEGDSLDHRFPLRWRVEGLLSPEECRSWIDRIEAAPLEGARIETGAGQAYRPGIRNCKRWMNDDPPLAAEIHRRLAQHLPDGLMNRRPRGVNERFRYLKYDPGEKFAPHLDGAFVRAPTEASLLTLMIYLNDDFEGGELVFHDDGEVVRPRPGLGYLFQHCQRHEARPVSTGIKYCTRTDVLYDYAPNPEAPAPPGSSSVGGP